MSFITKDLDLIVELLLSGYPVGIPTETVYGLAANAENDMAIKKIYYLKKRPLDHPLIMHVGIDADLTKWVTKIPSYVVKLIEYFWPGPLTFVLPKKSTVSDLITAATNTIAIRCPKHPLTQKLLNTLQFPLVAPSANKFGKLSPTTALQVQENFVDENVGVLDGGRCQLGIESTIIAAIHDEGYQILRHGAITRQQINAVIPNLELPGINNVQAPGMLPKHYQPEKKCYIFSNWRQLYEVTSQYKRGIIFHFLHNKVSNNLDNILTKKKNYVYHELEFDPTVVAFELYHQLYLADKTNVDFIAFELPPYNKGWEAITERLIKAGQIIT